MKVLKIIGLVLLGIIVLVVIISLFLPKTVVVKNEVVIDQPPRMAFAQVNDPRKWKAWSVWDQMDPDMKDYFEGAESGTGAIHRWESEMSSVGHGSMEIVESKPNEVINIEFDFGGDGTATSTYSFANEGGTTRLSTEFTFDVSTPIVIGPIIGVMMKGVIDENTAKSLNNIKEIVEDMQTYIVDIGQEEVESYTYLGVTNTVGSDEMAGMSEMMGNMYGEIMSYMAANELEMAPERHPITVYHDWSESGITMECGLPVENVDAVESDRIMLKNTYGGLTVIAVHLGDYNQLEATHGVVDIYVDDNDLRVTGPPWEEYVTDPGQEPDTTKWMTHVYYPVERKN